MKQEPEAIALLQGAVIGVKLKNGNPANRASDVLMKPIGINTEGQILCRYKASPFGEHEYAEEYFWPNDLYILAEVQPPTPHG